MNRTFKQQQQENNTSIKKDLAFNRFLSIKTIVLLLLTFISVSNFVDPSCSHALPFNTDMMSSQPLNGQIMRPAPSDSVHVGSSERFVGTREEAASLQNPIPRSRLSVTRGQRLFTANCSPCHGKYIDGKHVPGAVSKSLPGVDLSMEPIKVKPDSHFFQFIHFGGMAIMPAYGSKFSIPEHWDIVNYIRHVQEGGK